MTLFTEQQYQKLIENGKPENRDKDHAPIAHLTFPGTACEWLVSELDPEDVHIAFGLCDLGQGFPELGYIDLDELQRIKIGIFGFTVFNNPLFVPKYKMSVYAEAARNASQITRDEQLLEQAHQQLLQQNKRNPKL